MQISPIAYRPAFGAAKPQAARFGSQDVSTTSAASLSTSKADPALMAELQKSEAALDHFYNAVQTGTVEFIEAKEGLPELAQITEQTTLPVITFKLNGQPYEFNIRSMGTPEGMAYSIEAKEGEKTKIKYSHFPKSSQNRNTSLEFMTFYQGQCALTHWTPNAHYPQTIGLNRSTSSFPRPDLVQKAEALGILVLQKLGESRQTQGLTGSLLQAPQSQLDHRA